MHNFARWHHARLFGEWSDLFFLVEESEIPLPPALPKPVRQESPSSVEELIAA